VDPMEWLFCFGDDDNITCPYCQANLTVTSEEARLGEEVFECCECQGVFTIDWDQEKIYYNN
jgi:hypothetical protein